MRDAKNNIQNSRWQTADSALMGTNGQVHRAKGRAQTFLLQLALRYPGAARVGASRSSDSAVSSGTNSQGQPAATRTTSPEAYPQLVVCQSESPAG